MKDKFYNAIGLARRANKIVYGETLYAKFKTNNVYLVIVAADISEKSLIRLKKKLDFYQIEYILDVDSFALTNAIAKDNIKAIGIVDENFKNLILNIIREGGV